MSGGNFLSRAKKTNSYNPKDKNKSEHKRE